MRKILLTAIALLAAFQAYCQDVSEQSQRKQKIEEEISFINNQLKDISTKQKASTKQLMLIQQQVTSRRKLIKAIDDQIAKVERQMVEKQRTINRLQKELDTLQTYYNNLILNSYKNRDTKVWFMYILGSENIGQGYRRFVYLKNLAGEANRQGEKIKEAREQMKEEKGELARMRADAGKQRNERESEYKKLKEEETRSKKTLTSLSKTEKQYRSELARKRREVEALDREIRRILNKEIASQNKDKTHIDYALAGKFEGNRGKLPWPVKQGVITERFGVHNHPVYKNLKLPECNGVTFSTERGAEVFSVFDGVVKQIVVMPGYDQCVLIQHGTYFTFYCKLGNVAVKSGQTVARGQKLGTLEPETKSSSSLHFQIWNGTSKQNPENWLVD